jgi:N utilization substance protein A
MINKDFFLALDDLEREKGIKKDVFIATLETALTSACKRNYGEAVNVQVKLNPEKNTIRIFKYKKIVDEVTDPDKEISLTEARETKKSFKTGDILSEEITPRDFGRIAAQTAKQVVYQKLRETERELAINEYQEKEGEIITVVVRRSEGANIMVEMGNSQMEGLLRLSDQVRGERYEPNMRIKVYVKQVQSDNRGAHVLVSRSSFGLVKKLFENEVPEIRGGLVEIKGLVREAGYRSKIAVASNAAGVDAVGACVGNRGARVNAVVGELNGEKIDIIEWSANPAEYIARALSPAKVLTVAANEDTKAALVVVPDEKLSLAIGKDGQNVRLAARLTGWKIDVKSYNDSLKEPNASDAAGGKKKAAGEKGREAKAVVSSLDESDIDSTLSALDFGDDDGGLL